MTSELARALYLDRVRNEPYFTPLEQYLNDPANWKAAAREPSPAEYEMAKNYLRKQRK